MCNEGAIVIRHPSSRRKSPPLRLTGKRLMLRPLTGGDFAAWRESRARNRAWLEPWEPTAAWQTFEAIRDRGTFERRCVARDRERESGLAFPFGMFFQQRLIGEINLNGISRGALQSATVGYWIDEDHAGHGFTAEAVVIVVKFALEQLGLHRVEIGIIPRNNNSRRVMEKLRFRNEGIAERLVEINGVWEDHVRYAITAEEWHVRAGELSANWLDRGEGFAAPRPV